MEMNSVNEWEARLKKLGMPSEIQSEQEKAAEAGVELISTDMASSEAEALALKLKKEDPRNILGGFPNSTDSVVSLVETLREEWLAQDISPKDIHLVIHASCVNGHDCITLAYNGGKIYHYNTKNIHGYSREKMVSKLRTHNLSFVEK
ncbi:MAG: hypothetical protein AAB902_02150 [Patescibacteria group bacterium]